MNKYEDFVKVGEQVNVRFPCEGGEMHVTGWYVTAIDDSSIWLNEIKFPTDYCIFYIDPIEVKK